jgi:hypothetical protein
MAGDAEQGPERVAWDRLGRFFGDMAAVAQKVSSRNLTLWNTVSSNLRSPGYSADAMASDAAKAMAVAIDNLDDLWTSLTRVPEREQVAVPLPTAFLYFALQDGEDGVYDLAESVWIRVAPTDLETLPRYATIGLDGPERGVQALKASLRATREATKGYRLEAYGVGKLEPGVYSGAVYLTDPRPRQLANLRVVVEGPTGEQGDEGARAAD